MMDADDEYETLCRQIEGLREVAAEAGVYIDDLDAGYRAQRQDAAAVYDEATETARAALLPNDWAGYLVARAPAVADLVEARLVAARSHVFRLQSAIRMTSGAEA